MKKPIEIIELDNKRKRTIPEILLMILIIGLAIVVAYIAFWVAAFVLAVGAVYLLYRFVMNWLGFEQKPRW